MFPSQNSNVETHGFPTPEAHALAFLKFGGLHLPSSADFSGEKRREELQGCSTSSWFFFGEWKPKSTLCAWAKQRSRNEINLFFEIDDLGHVPSWKKNTHQNNTYINGPPPLNKPKTPPLNKKTHSLIPSISVFFLDLSSNKKITFNLHSIVRRCLTFGCPGQDAWQSEAWGVGARGEVLSPKFFPKWMI